MKLPRQKKGRDRGLSAIALVSITVCSGKVWRRRILAISGVAEPDTDQTPVWLSRQCRPTLGARDARPPNANNAPFAIPPPSS